MTQMVPSRSKRPVAKPNPDATTLLFNVMEDVGSRQNVAKDHAAVVEQLMSLAERAREELGDVTGKTFYMCGPSAMYDFCGPQLEALGIPKRKIRRELYGAPRSISECPGWPDDVSEDTEAAHW